VIDGIANLISHLRFILKLYALSCNRFWQLLTLNYLMILDYVMPAGLVLTTGNALNLLLKSLETPFLLLAMIVFI